MSFRQSHLAMCALFAAGALSGVASAQGVHNNQYLQFTQSHGLTFSTIRGPVNPTSVELGVPGVGTDWVRGGSYDYRISTTELKVSQ